MNVFRVLSWSALFALICRSENFKCHYYNYITRHYYEVIYFRKELVESGELSVQDELKLSALVLTKHPKSSETFIHR